ncbi:MAG: hypothetical protein ACI809_001591, partial [Candidatus Azotimanducaceae bacterium]
MEVGSIALAALLALGVSEWQEDRQEKELARTALANVKTNNLFLVYRYRKHPG